MNNVEMEYERRRFERKPTSIRVEMTNPSFGTIVGFARDISDGGASVLIENYQIPPVGTIVEVKFKRMVGAINNDTVKMQIVHQHRKLVGLMFVPDAC